MEIRKLISKDIKSMEDIKQILDFIVWSTRKELDVKDSNTRLCQKSSGILRDICHDLDIPYIPFCMSEIGMKDLEHHFGVTGFQTEFGQICFLLDLTYIQFTKQEYPVNGNNILSPGESMTDENKNVLVQKGYLTLTEEILDEYISGFIESHKLVSTTNELYIYDKLYGLLNKFHINIADKDYLNNKGFNY